ncbi:MAG: hypothetical protein V1690_00250 [Candidatus Moraniibacteriota bacterium]
MDVCRSRYCCGCSIGSGCFNPINLRSINHRSASRSVKEFQETKKGESVMKTFWKACIVAMVLVIGIFFRIPFAQADEPAEKTIGRQKVLDGITFEPDGKYSWIDSYINEVRRPEMYLWLDPDTFGEYARSIRYEANFLIYGAGITPKQIETRVKNKEGTNKFFRRAFCTEIEATKKDNKGRDVYNKGEPVKECKRVCVGNPDEQIILVVRKITDGPNRNTGYIFTYIGKEDAFKLGCKDKDVVDYVNGKNQETQ